MKTNILSLITIATAILLTSCEKEIEFNGEQTEPKLVINSVAVTGQPVKAYVSKSYFFLDNEENAQVPDDVVVSLYVNGQPMGEMTPFMDTIWGATYYWEGETSYRLKKAFGHPYCPNVGDVIKITASANGFDDAEGSSSTLPEKPTWRITEMRLKEKNLWPYFDETSNDTVWYADGTVDVKVEITDTHPGIVDCFRLRLEEGSHFIDGYDPQTYYYQAWPNYTDPIFDGVSPTGVDFVDYQLEEPNGTFVDQLFDGRSYTISLPISFHYTVAKNVPSDFFHIEMYMEHFTKEYFNYLNTNQQGSEMSAFFSEPVQTFSNVDGGFGIVGGRTVDTLQVVLPMEE